MDLTSLGERRTAMCVIQCGVRGEVGQQRQRALGPVVEPRRQTPAAVANGGKACILSGLGDHLCPSGHRFPRAVVAIDQAVQSIAQSGGAPGAQVVVLLLEEEIAPPVVLPAGSIGQRQGGFPGPVIVGQRQLVIVPVLRRAATQRSQHRCTNDLVVPESVRLSDDERQPSEPVEIHRPVGDDSDDIFVEPSRERARASGLLFVPVRLHSQEAINGAVAVVVDDIGTVGGGFGEGRHQNRQPAGELQDGLDRLRVVHAAGGQ